MKIAIEALGISQPGGGRSATLNLLEALFEIDTENRYLVFVDALEPSLDHKHVRQKVIPIKHRLLARLGAQLVLPAVLRQEGVELTHFVKSLGLALVPSKTVVTIFDLTILRYPDIYPAIDVWYWRAIEPRTLRRADRVIAISQHTADDLERFYQLPPERIVVIYPCASPTFRPAGEAEIARVRARYGLLRETIIHVGSISRKKNLTTLVKAFARFRQATGFPGQLVLVGREYGKGRDEELSRSISALGLEEAVVFTGPVPDQDLPPLYSASALCVFPSLHEGFGLVALEAMACGVPLITTAVGAIAEVVGEAALVLRNPTDENELSLALRRVLEDPDLRGQMIEQGLAQTGRFSRAEAARQTLQLYREVAGANES